MEDALRTFDVMCEAGVGHNAITTNRLLRACLEASMPSAALLRLRSSLSAGAHAADGETCDLADKLISLAQEEGSTPPEDIQAIRKLIEPIRQRAQARRK